MARAFRALVIRAREPQVKRRARAASDDSGRPGRVHAWFDLLSGAASSVRIDAYFDQSRRPPHPSRGSGHRSLSAGPAVRPAAPIAGRSSTVTRHPKHTAGLMFRGRSGEARRLGADSARGFRNNSSAHDRRRRADLLARACHRLAEEGAGCGGEEDHQASGSASCVAMVETTRSRNGDRFPRLGRFAVTIDAEEHAAAPPERPAHAQQRCALRPKIARAQRQP